ncbi:MAG: hypothetical protein ACOC4M_15530 [Promethearchaeia archaeon]
MPESTSEELTRLKAKVKEIVNKIQLAKRQLEHSQISLNEFRARRRGLQEKLRGILKRISLLKESLEFNLRIQKESEMGIEEEREMQISKKAKNLIYLFKNELEELVNKGNIYLSGFMGENQLELGFFELYYPPIALRDQNFPVTGMLIQRGVYNIKMEVDLSISRNKTQQRNKGKNGFTIELPPETPNAISFQIKAKKTHLYSLTARLLEIDGNKIEEEHYIHFDFEVKILPFKELDKKADLFDTKTGRYLIYTYLACDNERAELFGELHESLKRFGVQNFEPLLKIIPGFDQTMKVLKLGRDINETIIFMIDNFKKIQEYYKYEKIGKLEDELIYETEKLFKFSPEGIILRPLENLDNVLPLSMLFRSFFKTCKLGVRKLRILQNVLDIGKKYGYDVSKYFTYIKSIKKSPEMVEVFK